MMIFECLKTETCIVNVNKIKRCGCLFEIGFHLDQGGLKLKLFRHVLKFLILLPPFSSIGNAGMHYHIVYIIISSNLGILHARQPLYPWNHILAIK